MNASLLRRVQNSSLRENAEFRPILLSESKLQHRKTLLRLLKTRKVQRVIDDWPQQAEEFRFLQNPRRIRHATQAPQSHARSPLSLPHGQWVFYPWLRVLVRILDRRRFETLRLSRNAGLILPEEQKRFTAMRVGIAGLNVGNPAAVCIALEGGAQEMKLADPDELTLSNLNRFRASIADLNLNKAILTARQIYEINPFANLTVLPQGITTGLETAFLLKPRIGVLIEEMDNLKLKIAIREKARQHRIPVLMVTGNGPNIILDVERFDVNPRLPLLNGHLRPRVIQNIQSLIPGKGTFRERVLLARDFMGASFLVPRLRKSFPKIGTKLVGIPQLAEASFLRGAALCYAVRLLATGKPLPSGRFALRLDTLLKP